MIIGKGLIAKAFAREWLHDASTAIVAAGVSDSGETRRAAFEREELLVSGVLSDTCFSRIVYFGSCAVGNPGEILTPYIEHKKRMEELILSDPRGHVFRLPQVVGYGGNPHTLVNFLRSRIDLCDTFDIWAKAERNLIDIDDVASLATHVLRHCLDYPRLMSLADIRSTNMLMIVQQLEDVMGKKGVYRVLDLGNPFFIDTEYCRRAAQECGILLGDGYLKALLAKYHAAK